MPIISYLIKLKDAGRDADKNVLTLPKYMFFSDHVNITVRGTQQNTKSSVNLWACFCYIRTLL